MTELIFTNEDIDIQITEDLVDSCEAEVQAAIDEISKYEDKTLSLTKYSENISYFFHKPNAFKAIKAKLIKMHGSYESREEHYGQIMEKREADKTSKSTQPIVILYSDYEESFIYLYCGRHNLHKLFHVKFSKDNSFEVIYDLIKLTTSSISGIEKRIFPSNAPFAKACGTSGYSRDLALRLMKLKNSMLPRHLKGFYGSYFDQDILNMYSTSGHSEELIEFCRVYPSYFKIAISYNLGRDDFTYSSCDITDRLVMKKIRNAICQKKKVDLTVRETLQEMFPTNDDIYKISKRFKPNFVPINPYVLERSIFSILGIDIEKLNSFEFCWAAKHSDLQDKIYFFRNQINKKGDITKMIKAFQCHLGKRKIRTTFDDLENITDTVRFLANHGFKAQNPRVLMDIDRRYHDIHHILLSKAANLIDLDSYKSDLLEEKRVTFNNVDDKASVSMLISEDDFINEGIEMEHCVGAYYNSFCRGELFIFSIETENERSTLEVRLRNVKMQKDYKFSVAQHRTTGNSKVIHNGAVAKLIIDQLNEDIDNTKRKLHIKIPTSKPTKILDEDFNEYFKKRFKLKKINEAELDKIMTQY